jgi:hypothetical protein
VNGARGEFRGLFSRIDLLLEYLGASLIYSLIVTLGLILLVVPEIIRAIQFGFLRF